ncbi:SDR family oxidoreductase [Rhizobium laguerreae]|uniref:SDR family oxidoreductase n=1 Tax=Rhizobium laguerreae TaxID=1076926 RepID=UPI00143F81A3|nr:SDR family oxidoreductase [Rhizobium laguerreae]NKM88140.1 SDR family oxidoreductase [Rhizobium laguerreae]
MSDTDNSRRTFLALAAAVPSAIAMSGIASAQSSDTGAIARQSDKRGAIVTGSSRGIGAATARRLARDGYAVTVNYLTNRDLAEAVVRDIEAAGGRAIVRQGDVADPAAVKALFDANDEAFGGVDVVVNNAGIMNVGPFAQMTDEAFDRMMATNVKGSFNVLREASRRVRDGGRIISLSSSIIKMSPPGTAAYAATKAAQEIYSNVLAKELGGRNISVNAISPGAVDTQLLRQHGEEALRGIPEATPLHRLGQPEDIANVIALLCSQDGAWIDGQNVFANGGIA